ncbi:hypothetical protein N8I77_008851 [Diaporthe amygdali]|uniref:Membrane insertase YidC/Oxa/ALB C-terminal domain-containing protein n=1 Tax=Phomopsis amygdali TaxID=1214568 RepID=A0AAD9SA57_PHOAM|nr:hypothetical protein N8I77_008851 [Diaporthe amygdali]
MIPSRGFARVSPGLAFQNQIFSRAPGRSIPRRARSVATTRQFGTSLKANGRPFHGAYSASVSSGSRIGAAAILSSSSVFLSSTRQARFASTGSSPSPAESAASLPSSSSPESLSTPSDFPSDFSSLTDLDGASLLNTPETIGYLHNLGLDYGWGPTAFSQWFVEHLHIWGGLPWWASIIGFAAIVRLVLAKPALVAQQESVKMNKMRKDPLFNSLQEKWMTAMAGGAALPPAEMMQLRLQMSLVREQYDVKTWKMFLPMLQAPIAYGMFRLTTGMAALPVPGLDTAGMLWFTDLTAPDPYMILPLRAVPYMNPQQAAFMRVMPWILGPLGFFITWKMAASVQVFFAATAILQFAQTTFFHIGWIRKVCGLPPLEEMKQSTSGGPTMPRISPISSRSAQYQAPRTINTTATEKVESNTDSDNPIHAVKGAWAGIQDKLKKRSESNAQKNTQKEAAQYEKKRLQEEHEQFLRRREAARRHESK